MDNLGYYTTSFEGFFEANRPFSNRIAELLQDCQEGEETISGAPLDCNTWTVSRENSRRLVGPEEASRSYDYIEWLECLVAFLGRKGYILNGTVCWNGKGETDKGKLVVENNKLTIYDAVFNITYEMRK